MLTARITALLAAAIWSGSSIESTYSVAPPETPTLSEITAVGTGSPKSALCEPGVSQLPCVALPIFVKGKSEDGTALSLTVDYTVGSDLIERIKNDFGSTTPAVLRNVQKSLAVGAKAPDREVRIASKSMLPAVTAKVPYSVASGVRMPLKVEEKVAEVATAAVNRTGKKLTITSGTRSSERQAEAMRVKISLGENLTRLYANKSAVSQVLHAYRSAKQAGLGKDGIRNAMAEVIDRQVDQGVYLSNHLREGAVDIRTRDMSRYQKQAVLQAIDSVPGVRALDESTPPHIHLDVL